MAEYKPANDIPPELMAKIASMGRDYMHADRLTKAESFRALNKIAPKGGIVFAGDSITEGYPLGELFPRALPLYNRGIGGVTAVEVLENLDAYALDLKPKKLFLLIGTNDLGNGASVEDTAETIKAICMKTAALCPETKIYLISVYPVDSSNSRQAEGAFFGPSSRNNEAIKRLNRLLQQWSQSMPGVNFLDIYPLLAGEEGSLKKEYSTDGLHLSVEGYRAVTKALTPHVEQEAPA